MNLRKLISWKDALTYRQKVIGLVLCGLIVGLGLLFAYLLRLHTYIIGDDPGACVNCHIMAPYYATWSHSSHGRDATCNDCHVPHQNIAMKYLFKGMDGMKQLHPLPRPAQPRVCQDRTHQLHDGQAWRGTGLLGLPPQCAPWRHERTGQDTQCRESGAYPAKPCARVAAKGLGQVTGHAVFIDERPQPKGHCIFLTTNKKKRIYNY